jgi:hypothetical protein
MRTLPCLRSCWCRRSPIILHQLDEDFFESLGAFDQQKDLPADLGIRVA